MFPLHALFDRLGAALGATQDLRHGLLGMVDPARHRCRPEERDERIVRDIAAAYRRARSRGFRFR